MLSLLSLLSIASPLVAAAGLSDSSLVKHVNSLELSFSFNPVKAAYWTGLPHHRRTPFALSTDGTTAYLAYLDDSETDVHIQQVDPSTFAAVGTPVTVTGAKEAGGLVAHNDGFALLTNVALPNGTTDAPADSTPVPVLYRYTNGKQTFETFLGGPGVHADDGLSASPDLNGDLVYSEAADLYGAYFVVTDYSGWAEGHYGDSVEYVSASNGTLETLSVSSDWGCSHNTGIAFEAADSAPFASICAEDQGAIWLNTNNRGMSTEGVKISNENTTNGASGESMGGMSGSYSGLARYQSSDEYIFAWVSRGAVDLTENTWMGDGYTSASNRTNGRNVAIASFSDKETIVGNQASSTVGAADGDAQVNWITTGTADCSNAHVATFDSSNALVTWEEIAEPQCDFIAMGCSGTFSGSYYQLISNGTKVGEPIKSMDVFVAGDMVTFPDNRICFPYVNMTWSLDAVSGYDTAATASTRQISFACISAGDSNSTTNAASTSSTAVAASSAASSVSSIVAVTLVQKTTSAASAVAVAASSSAVVSSVVAPVSSAVASSSDVASSIAAPVSSAAASSAIASSATSAAISSIPAAAAASSTVQNSSIKTKTKTTKSHPTTLATKVVSASSIASTAANSTTAAAATTSLAEATTWTGTEEQQQEWWAFWAKMFPNGN